MQLNGTTQRFQAAFPAVLPAVLRSAWLARRIPVLSLLLIGCFAIGGCTSPSSLTAVQNGKQAKHCRIAVTNFSLFCAVKTICGQAESPVKEVIYCGPKQDADPHTWIPSLEQIRDLQKVDLIVCNGPGAQFSTWLDKVTFDESKLVRTTDAMDLEEFMLVKDYQLVHSHGPEGEHSHAWVVPQSWLSPRVARKQATLCFEKIVEVYGQHRTLEEGFAKLQRSFDDLQAACEQLCELHRGFVVVTSSPEVSYLTRELGWSDRYLQLSEGSSEAEAERMLMAMRARIAKQASGDAAVSETPEALFLWAGQATRATKATKATKATRALERFVEQQWEASVEIDLIETSSDGGLDSNGYFERMAKNLQVIRAAIK